MSVSTLYSPLTNQDFATAILHISRDRKLVFSKFEKISLGVIGCLAFAIPLSLVLSASSQSGLQILSASSSSSTIASSVIPRSVERQGDEESLAAYFAKRAATILDQDSTSLRNQQEARLLLSQAQTQLALVPADSPHQQEVRLAVQLAQSKLDSSLATIIGSELEYKQVVSPQRIGASSAGPTNEEVEAVATSNTKQGTVTLEQGTQRLWVSYPKLQAHSQIYLVPEAKQTNTIVYVKSKETNAGFFIESTSPMEKDLSVTWYEILE